MALTKRKNDIKFFNLETGEVVCTFNQCLHKFTEVGSQEKVRTPIVGIDDDNKFIKVEVVSDSFYHQCSECGRKIADKNDKSKSFDSYLENKSKQITSPNRKIVL